jgi:hypothetical protein
MLIRFRRGAPVACRYGYNSARQMAIWQAPPSAAKPQVSVPSGQSVVRFFNPPLQRAIENTNACILHTAINWTHLPRIIAAKSERIRIFRFLIV